MLDTKLLEGKEINVPSITMLPANIISFLKKIKANDISFFFQRQHLFSIRLENYKYAIMN
jgi:hypothetical protein